MTALDKSAVIGVIGAGTMGAGIAQVAASAGHRVWLYDVTENAATLGVQKLTSGLQKLVDKGRIDDQRLQQIIGNISVADSLKDLADCSLVIEAIVENLEIKQKLFTKLETLCRDSTILASNTSSLSLTAIGAPLKRPEKLVGIHFFNPAPIMKLVEIISSLATGKSVADTAFDTIAEWGKKPVHARSTPGFIVNRVARPFYAEGLRMLEEGTASVATIDSIIKDAGGFRMGPFELMDLIGHDVNYAVTCSVFDAYYGDPRFKPSLTQKELVDAGFLGRKSGRGFYRYDKTADAEQPETVTSKHSPDHIVLSGNSDFIQQCAALLEQSDFNFDRADSTDSFIQAGTARICLTNGKTATLLANESQETDLVIVDLTLDFKSATRVALAAADQTSKQALNEATGFFQVIGKTVSIIDDSPGLCVMRTVCMLANEGADAVNQMVCNAEAVDIAMKNGVNYPKGPLQWASELGLPMVVEVLDNLYAYYGEDRYRVSPLLRRKAYTGDSLYE